MNRSPRPAPRSVRVPPAAPKRQENVVLNAIELMSPLVITGAVAAARSFVPVPGQIAALPVGLLLVLSVQALGILIAREVERPRWQSVWQMLLSFTAILMPVLVLQAATARAAFVALANGAAAPVIWSTIAAIIVMFSVATLSVMLAGDAPDQAAMLFMPAALLVPAVVAAPGDFSEQSIVVVVVETSAIAALAAAIGWLLAPRERLFVPPIALVVQFVTLFLIGYRPMLSPGGGAIGPIMTVLLIFSTALTTVGVPLAAVALRGVRQASVGEEPGVVAPAPVGRR